MNRSIAAVALLVGMSGAATAQEPLLYEVDGDRVVFTNVPNGPNARPVPGFEPLVLPNTSGTMPSTIYDPFIERVARELGLAPDLIKAVALVESGFDPHAVSPRGAQGLMQLMPATAAAYGVDDAFDPLQNLRAGAVHLRDLMDEFGGNTTLALAAYNAGAGAVRRHGGVPAYRETRDYVRKVQGHLAPGSRRVEADAEPPGDIKLVRGPDGSILFAN